MPAGTSTSHRLLRRWYRLASTTARPAAKAVRGAPTAQLRAASASGPISTHATSGAHVRGSTTRTGPGGRSGKRRSWPYAEPCAKVSPTSPLKASSVATAANATATMPAVAEAPAPHAAPPTAIDPGVIVRSTVSETVVGTSATSITTPHAAHVPIVPTIWTARLRPSSASPIAGPVANTSATHDTRNSHTAICFTHTDLLRTVHHDERRGSEQVGEPTGGPKGGEHHEHRSSPRFPNRHRQPAVP